MAVEEEFGISIADEDAEKLITIGGLIDYVSAKIKGSPVAPGNAVPAALETGENVIPMPVGRPIKIVATFVRITSGTEELDFDWIVNPFDSKPNNPLPAPTVTDDTH